MLDKNSRELLRFIRDRKHVTNKDIETKYNSEMVEELSLLENSKFIKRTIEEMDTAHGFMFASLISYTITPEGRACLEAHTWERIKVIYPYVISTLALLLSAFNTLKIYGIL